MTITITIIESNFKDSKEVSFSLFYISICIVENVHVVGGREGENALNYVGMQKHIKQLF